MEKFVISVRQFKIIVILFSIGTAILIIPGPIAEIVKQDAWITAILGVVISLLLVKLYIVVGNLAPNMSLVELNEKILGKWFGMLVSLAFIIFSLLTGSELVYFVSNFMLTEIMPETPAIAFNILFALIIVYGTYLGLENIARSAELLFPFFVLLFIIFIVTISPQIDVHHIQPVLETGAKPLIFSTLIFLGTMSFPLVVLLMIFPVSINEQVVAQKAFYIGTITGGIVLIIVITLAILVLGAENTAHSSFPSYALAKRISIGTFFERVEAIMTFMWIMTILFKTLIYFYATVIGLGQIIKIKDCRSLVLPLGMILVVLSLIVHPNIVHSYKYNNETWLPYVATYGLFLPLLLLLVAKIRKL
ncbi:spore gernimation protein [Bacillus sp. FJAT-22090]|uniref:GerAB/ArcD/ProY family transporter n=1 Tax=Bacillus sp. FJAT-22090 TaxID=1581038 RepID=UPI0006AEB9C5|nr:endospore germination permease [Bacillus sp. FJAT-22090]ALC85195.1 spore gernimation protein [Bacillus sp. FJAT-22090]